MEEKILKISQIKIDEKLYPRTKCDWFTANDYKHSMKAGAVFPPIEVALYRGHYYLIDGRHRIEATKRCKEENIQTIVHLNLTAKEIFIKAVEANISHGRPLSPQDKALVIDRLEKLNFNEMEISRMVNIPLDKLEAFKFNKITNTVSGEAVYLKGPSSNYAGVQVSNDFDNNQSTFSAMGQIHLLKQAIALIENGMVDFKNEDINRLFIKWKSLVKAVKIPLIVKR